MLLCAPSSRGIRCRFNLKGGISLRCLERSGCLVARRARATDAQCFYRFSGTTSRRTSTFMKSFLERLNELGYREGDNMIFNCRSAEGAPERLPQLAADAVRAHPDVLVTGMGTLAAKAAKAATSTIPVVFTAVGDPVGAGLVANLGRPAPTSPG